MSMQEETSLNYRNIRTGQSLRLRISNPTFQIIKEQLALIFFFVSTVILVYFFPPIISKVLLLGLLVFFWFSKKDYFWFALFFVFIQQPGWFFAEATRESLYRLPLYTFLPGMAFSLEDLFVVLALVKALLKGKKTKLEMKKPIILISIYIIFSLIISMTAGASLPLLVNFLRGPFYYTIIISFLYLIKDKREARSFMMITLPFVFFTVFTQIYLLIKGTEFINIFNPGFRKTYFIGDTARIRATSGGALLTFFAYISCFFLVEDKGSKISKKFLYIVISFSFLSVIISATRLWFIVSLLVIFGYFLLSKKMASNVIKIILVFFVVVCILLLIGALKLDFLMKGAIPRLTEISAFAKGDLELAPATFKNRYFFRLPRLWEGAKQYLFFGCGFTLTYFRYYDYHVGFFNTILQFGLVGLSLFLYFFWSYFYLIRKTVKGLSKENSLRHSLRFLSIAFAVIVFANFWTWYFFPMDGNTYNSFFIAIFIGLTEVFIREAKREDLKLKN